jgi:heavy metal sensor kinase
MFDSVRLRLTSWYVAVLGFVLIAFSTGAYIFVERNLYARLDVSLRSTLEVATASLHRAGTKSATGENILKALEELHAPNQAIAVLDAEGRLLGEKPSASNTHVRLPRSGLSAADGVTFYSLPEQTDESDDSCRGAVQPIRLAGSDAPYLLVVNQSLEPVADQLDLLQNIFLVTVPLTLALSGIGGWLLAHRSLAPVVQMSEHARRIGAENLEQRLPVANPRDELGRLAATFNQLLARLSDSFSQQRQFMADASHELRTPLSVIRTASAVTLQQEDREKGEYREALTIVEQQARRLTRLVEDMFVLARADAGHPTLQAAEFYLDELLAETTRAAAVLAAEKGLRLEVPPLPEEPFRGDEELLRRMLWNLFDNAIKYTPKGGTVRVALESRDTECVVTVADTGTGIAPEIQPRIFERFYRADEARSRAGNSNEGGAGLGLPIARWVAEAHHGRLELQRSDETGTTFVVHLPRT